MSQSQLRSLHDIISRRQKEDFVGRQEQRDFFHQNLEYDLDDERKCFIINISGQGGVGKTWLMRRQFQKITEESGMLTAYLDETVTNVPDVMACISDQFKAQGYPLKSFINRYQTYRQRKQDIETDPEAPPEALETVGRDRSHLIRAVPYGGTITGLFNEDQVTNLSEDIRDFLWEPPHLGDSKKQPIVRSFNLKNIRTLLIEGFTDEDLRRLCFDEANFRSVYEQLTQGMGKDSLIDKLVEYAERKELIETLLALVKEHNPTKYKRHQPYYLVTVDPTTSSGVYGNPHRTLGGKLGSYLASKLGNKDDIELVLVPEKVLTPLFLTDLRKVAIKRRIAFFFDT